MRGLVRHSNAEGGGGQVAERAGEGLRVLVTGGGTVAPIDDVRVIANVSTGRFAAQISEALLEVGASVWHIGAPTAETPIVREASFDIEAVDLGVEVGRLLALRERWRALKGRLRLVRLFEGTVSEYARAVERVLRDGAIDLVILAAAVSDYEPVAVEGKIESREPELRVTCRRAQKVIESVREWSPGSFLVGFKLLSGVSSLGLIEAARAANLASRADLTVANDLKEKRAGRHALWVVDPSGGSERLPPGDDLARRLVGLILGRMGHGVEAC